MEDGTHDRNTLTRAEDRGKGQTLVLETFLAYRIRRIADAVSLDFSRIYRDRFGLTRPEWRTLATLGQFGTTTASAIGAHSAMHKTKVSRAVAELERRRWLTRNTDPKDRRLEHLTLTRSGQAVYAELVPLALAFETDLMSRMQPADQAAVRHALAAIEAALGLASLSAGSPADDTEHVAERAKRADFAAFDRIMNRAGGQPPTPEDAL
jgi:DNA-binding MarR family transcriptional regulator